MRTIFCVLATLMLGLTSLQAQSLKAIKLNAPDKTRGASVMKALADRHSEREFANKKLSLQDLSDLMWAAIGINRAPVKFIFRCQHCQPLADLFLPYFPYIFWHPS